MGPGLKRSLLQAVATSKINDAVLLWQNQRFSNAYYLAGYAVEIGLKACIARQISANTIPDAAFIKGILSHNLGQLIGLAGLGLELKKTMAADPAFAANWAICAEWYPDQRYEAINQASAEPLLNAISNPTNGVMKWIRQHW